MKPGWLVQEAWGTGLARPRMAEGPGGPQVLGLGLGKKCVWALAANCLHRLLPSSFLLAVTRGSHHSLLPFLTFNGIRSSTDP